MFNSTTFGRDFLDSGIDMQVKKIALSVFKWAPGWRKYSVACLQTEQ